MAAAAVASAVMPPTFREPAICRSSSPFPSARRADFEPAKHLAFEPPKSSKSFADLGLPDSPLAPLAVTSPFPLFTREGVRELRRDVLSKDALEKYGVSSHFAAFQTREHSADCAPFAHQAFSHPDVLRAVSTAAGIELVPVMEIEKTHTNYQVGKGEVNLAKLRSLNLEPTPAETVSEAERADAEAKANADLGQGANVVNEHHDAYPFVAVCMLSDVSQMVGGETAIRCGDGSMIKARGPEVGSCVVMQVRRLPSLCVVSNLTLSKGSLRQPRGAQGLQHPRGASSLSNLLITTDSRPADHHGGQLPGQGPDAPRRLE